jgi:uncharacterized protein YndB with AHSA1/START domain
MTAQPNTTSRPIGTLRRQDGAGVVRMEDSFATGIHDLWAALTEPDRLARWIAHVQGDLRLGGRFEAKFTSGWEGPGRVDVCDPPHHLLVTMRPGEGEEAVIEAWLTPDGEHARLVVEERGLPLDDYAVHGAGWQAHIEDLGSYLAGRVPADWRTRWLELVPRYQAEAQAAGHTG